MRLHLPRILSITAIALLVVIGNAGCSETGSPRSAVSSTHPDTTGAARRLAGVVERLRTRIEAESRGLGALTVSGTAIQAVDLVTRGYEAHGFKPFWVSGTGPRASIDSLLAALHRADRDGLRAATYPLDRISALKRSIAASDSIRVGDLTDLELLCTDAFLLYASHLLTGRVAAVALVPTWNIRQREADLLALLRDATTSEDVAAALQTVRPRQPGYAALTDALMTYRTIAEAGGWPSVPGGETKLARGDLDPRISLLRQRLAVTEDLATHRVAPERSPTPDARSTPDDTSAVSPPSGADSVNVFDADLEEAVRRFQARHGLDVDGAVGPATLAALNVPVSRRIEQIIVNLERWRWLPDTLGPRHVLVNIAGFQMQVVENGEPVMDMRIVTGRPFRQTPVFSGEISYLVFNPYWHVPHTLAVEDKLPEIQSDRGYLARQNIKVFRGWSDPRPVDPATIDWAGLSAERFPYRLRQDPGPLNALGRVKFMFPNPHSVYLHDTPTRGLFSRAERSFSSGCIRLEQPMKLAEYLLADQPAWTSERIQSVLADASSERTVILKEKMPVHLLYQTAWVENEQVQFRNDVYDRDARVLEALQIGPPAI